MENIETVYNQMQPIILTTGKGTFVSVRKYAAELNVGYSAMRETMMRLCRDGLLEMVPGVGFFTKSLNFYELIEVFEGRECIEDYVIPKITDKLDEEDISILAGYNESQKEALSEKNNIRFTEMDFNFHSYLIDKFKNDQLSKFYKNIHHKCQLCFQYYIDYPSITPIEEQAAFLKRVQDKQFNVASNIFEQHSKGMLNRIKRLMSESFTGLHA